MADPRRNASNSIQVFLRSVPAVVRRHEATFQLAREEEVFLAPYGTAVDLMEALSPESSRSISERQEAVVWLLRRQRTAGHPLWQALLALAFAPMLRRLRRRVRSPEDADGRVLLAFFETVANLRATGRFVFLAVRRATTRALFPRRSGEIETVPLDDEEMPARPLHVDPSPFTVCLAHEVADRLARATGEGTSCRPDTMRRRQRRAIAALRAETERK